MEQGRRQQRVWRMFYFSNKRQIDISKQRCIKDASCRLLRRRHRRRAGRALSAARRPSDTLLVAFGGRRQLPRGRSSSTAGPFSQLPGRKMDESHGRRRYNTVRSCYICKFASKTRCCETCQHPMMMTACLPTCLPAYLPACLLVCLPACLSACTLARLPARQACLPLLSTTPPNRQGNLIFAQDAYNANASLRQSGYAEACSPTHHSFWHSPYSSAFEAQRT